MEDRQGLNRRILGIKWDRLKELAYTSALCVRLWEVEECLIRRPESGLCLHLCWGYWGRGARFCLDYLWGER